MFEKDLEMEVSFVVMIYTKNLEYANIETSHLTKMFTWKNMIVAYKE